MIKQLSYSLYNNYKNIADELAGSPFSENRDRILKDLIKDHNYLLPNAEHPYNRSEISVFIIYNSVTKSIHSRWAIMDLIQKDGKYITRMKLDNGNVFDDDEFILDILAIIQ